MLWQKLLTDTVAGGLMVLSKILQEPGETHL